MTMDRRRVLVVEDESLMSSLLADVLVNAGFEVEVAANVLQARVAVKEFDPDVALLDISLGEGPSGLDLAHVLHAQRPDIALIFLTKHPDRRTAGLHTEDIPPGCGFLRKDMVKDTGYLFEAIETVLADRPRQVRHDLEPDRPLAHLTSKQVDVLHMAAQGLTNAAIARERDTSERSVEMLMHTVLTELGIVASADVNPRVEAIRLYITAAGMPDRP